MLLFIGKGNFRDFGRLFLIIVCALMLAGCALSPKGVPVRIAERTYTASDDVVVNPDRGFYAWTEPIVPGAPVADFQAVRERGMTLAFSYLLLDAFRQAPLGPEYLETVSETFDAARAAGVKLIVRIAYDYPGRSSDDAVAVSLPQVEAHLEQLAPIFAAEADTLAIVQAGIIGPWGEWHSASPGLDTRAARDRVVAALTGAVPSQRFIQLRTPAFMMEQVPVPLPVESWYAGTPDARIAHHNDCFLASKDDMGTYFPPERSETLRAYLAAASSYGPVGGETCQADLPTQRSDCETALLEMERFHWSFLNADYDTRVLARWKARGCLAEIERRLGYRLSLETARLEWPEAEPVRRAVLDLTMKNTGWARVHAPRKAVLHLEPIGGGALVALALGGEEAPCLNCPEGVAPPHDARRWIPGPGETVTRRFALRLDEAIRPGRYRLALSLPDPSERLAGRPDFSIRFANDAIWDADTGEHDLGLVLDTRPAGDAVG